MNLPCLCFVASGQSSEAPHRRMPEDFERFRKGVYELRLKEGARFLTDEEYEQAFDMIETAFPR